MDGKIGQFLSSDERNCSFNCTDDQFKCLNGDCIPKDWKCDGKQFLKSPYFMNKKDMLFHEKRRYRRLVFDFTEKNCFFF